MNSAVSQLHTTLTATTSYVIKSSLPAMSARQIMITAAATNAGLLRINGISIMVEFVILSGLPAGWSEESHLDS